MSMITTRFIHAYIYPFDEKNPIELRESFTTHQLSKAKFLHKTVDDYTSSSCLHWRLRSLIQFVICPDIVAISIVPNLNFFLEKDFKILLCAQKEDKKMGFIAPYLSISEQKKWQVERPPESQTISNHDTIRSSMQDFADNNQLHNAVFFILTNFLEDETSLGITLTLNIQEKTLTKFWIKS